MYGVKATRWRVGLPLNTSTDSLSSMQDDGATLHHTYVNCL